MYSCNHKLGIFLEVEPLHLWKRLVIWPVCKKFSVGGGLWSDHNVCTHILHWFMFIRLSVLTLSCQKGGASSAPPPATLRLYRHSWEMIHPIITNLMCSIFGHICAYYYPNPPKMSRSWLCLSYSCCDKMTKIPPVKTGLRHWWSQGIG